ncbi:MAG TPA: SRPBCC family protein [Acidimicrobiales bacterium]|nr:SRPBCC family protein [Acidimicrobiales bacterium]
MVQPIEREIAIDAPVEVVWRAVTEPEQIAQWFVTGADIEARPGSEGSFSFRRDDGEVLRFHVTVTAVEPQRRFAYRWQHSEGTAPAEGNSVLVEFTLTPQGDGTLLRVVESGVDRMDWPESQQAEYARDHQGGWQGFLTRLRDLLDPQLAAKGS